MDTHVRNVNYGCIINLPWLTYHFKENTLVIGIIFEISHKVLKSTTLFLQPQIAPPFFSSEDINHNGVLSLAEIDKAATWLRVVASSESSGIWYPKE